MTEKNSLLWRLHFWKMNVLFFEKATLLVSMKNTIKFGQLAKKFCFANDWHRDAVEFNGCILGALSPWLELTGRLSVSLHLTKLC